MKKPSIINKKQSIYIKTAKQKVLHFLMRYPDKEFSLSDLAKEAGVSKANLGDILEEFHSEGIIDIIKLNVTWRIKANQQSNLFVRNKIINNLDFIYNSNLMDFLNTKFNHPKCIILFGSYRKGEDISYSDIDIAIEANVDEYTVATMKELADFEELIERKIQLHLFNRKNVDINLFNNIANGIVLSGFLEVRP